MTAGAVCHYDGKQVINLASTITGLANHPKLIEAAVKATRSWALGRARCGRLREPCASTWSWKKRLRGSKNVEAWYSRAGSQQCGTVSSILGKDDFILSDELNHASIIDGARLSRAKVKVFRHKDVDHCEELLKELANEPGTSW